MEKAKLAATNITNKESVLIRHHAPKEVIGRIGISKSFCAVPWLILQLQHFLMVASPRKTQKCNK